MAGGWAKDGAVSEQIEASINDELARLKARKQPQGESLTHCGGMRRADPGGAASGPSGGKAMHRVCAGTGCPVQSAGRD